LQPKGYAQQKSDFKSPNLDLGAIKNLPIGSFQFKASKDH
tara:strand:- start:190 stop:309 length:120 start_codon:yes stop_codon:yes gene_type:complete